MPATAGRVKMPANNRVSSSVALRTTDVWSKTIGYDPYAGAGDGAKKEDRASFEASQDLLSKARAVLGKSADVANRGACRKCGQIGHLTKDCRNFLMKTKPESSDSESDSSSSSSSSSSSDRKHHKHRHKHHHRHHRHHRSHRDDDGDSNRKSHHHKRRESDGGGSEKDRDHHEDKTRERHRDGDREKGSERSRDRHRDKDGEERHSAKDALRDCGRGEGFDGGRPRERERDSGRHSDGHRHHHHDADDFRVRRPHRSRSASPEHRR